MHEASTSAGLPPVDWRATDLGERAQWPHTLRLAVDIMLGSPCPMLLAWGERPVVAFNPAYAALAGPRHPPAPGGNVQLPCPAPLAAAGEAFARAAAGDAQHLRRVALAFPGRDGSASVECDLHLTPLADEAGAVLGVLCAVERSAPRAPDPARDSLRVLVVEDNLDSQYLVCEMLKAFGHHADGVAHAEGALALLSGAAYDVLFSDVSLPGMSGVDLAREALRAQPALQVIFASGYGDSLLRHLEFPFLSLQKPYEIEQLQAALAAAAAAPRPPGGPPSV